MKVLGEEHPSTLASVNNLAVVLRDLGKYEEAEALAPEGRVKTLREQRPSTLASVNLGLALKDLGKHEEVEAFHRGYAPEFKNKEGYIQP
jgi:hypothetical protein